MFCSVALSEPAFVLKGGVERNAQLEKLVVGSQFTKDILPKAGTKEFWYPIPDWFAGTWYREDIRELTDKGEIRSMSRAEGTRGKRRNSDGRICDVMKLPMIQVVDEDLRKLYFINREVEVVESSEKQVIIKIAGDVVTVDPLGKVVSFDPHSETLTAHPLEPGKVRILHYKSGSPPKRAYNDEYRIRKFE